METVGVELDHDPPLRPEEVDQMTLDQDVARRERELRRATVSQEVDLNSGACVAAPRIGPVGRLTQSSDARATTPFRDQPRQLPPAETTASLAGGDCPGQLEPIEVGSDVQQCALDRCHRDSEFGGDLAPIEAALQDPDSSAGAAAARAGHLHGAPPPPQTPQMSRAAAG